MTETMTDSVYGDVGEQRSNAKSVKPDHKRRSRRRLHYGLIWISPALLSILCLLVVGLRHVPTDNTVKQSKANVATANQQGEQMCSLFLKLDQYLSCRQAWDSRALQQYQQVAGTPSR
jgi:hypothetical protein